VTGRFTRD